MYNKLHTKDFMDNIPYQTFDSKLLYIALNNCYSNCAFSNIPYIIENCNSKNSIDKYKCGNCIALSLYIKEFLNSHNITSYLIPCSIPKLYQHPKYLYISHVSLAVPYKNKYIYILDPAFYFLLPLKIKINSTKKTHTLNKQIYMHENNNNLFDYKSIRKINANYINIGLNNYFNEYQTLPEYTHACVCSYDDDLNDTWKYFFTEITNPDKAISIFYTNIKNTALIVPTKLDINGICTSRYIISMDKLGYIYFKNNTQKEKIDIDSLFEKPYFKSRFNNDFKIKFKAYLYRYTQNKNFFININV